MAKSLANHKITFWGIIASFVFGLIIGGIAYLVIKIFNLKSKIWYLLFFFTPPVIGFFIYWKSKAIEVK